MADVKITVYDLLCRHMARLVDAKQVAGRHKAVFDAGLVASSVYFYRMQIGEGFFAHHSMVVVR